MGVFYLAQQQFFRSEVAVSRVSVGGNRSFRRGLIDRDPRVVVRYTPDRPRVDALCVVVTTPARWLPRYGAAARGDEIL
jgi:hypothetical protein